MADTHLQVNIDGTTSMRKTEIFPNNTEEKKQILLHIFERYNWHVKRLEHINGSNWEIECESNTSTLKINLFISSIRDESRQDDEFKMQLGTTYPTENRDGWLNVVLGIYVIKGETTNDYILAGYDISRFNFKTNPSIRGTRTSGLQKAYSLGMYFTDKSVMFRPDFIYYYLAGLQKGSFNSNTNDVDVRNITESEYVKGNVDYLSALRTKPFLLLAGISGTGKSRIVKEMAYASCPDEGDLREDKTSPGNYCLVEVKPNWNDSTELLGYETVLDGGNYHLTKFVKFLIKAMQHENIPFFVCLDEMNLAAVEQYFAEFLSILESRKDVDGTIKSEPLIPAAIFEKYQQKLHKELFPTKDSSKTSMGVGYYPADDGTAVYLHRTYAKLMEEGLRIPRNLIVVGTVNMDDTTYQFSRKVIDRAMTIEMNEVNLNDMFDIEKPDALSYREDVVDKGWFFAPFAQSNNALQQMKDERELLAEKIKATIGKTDADGTTTPDSLEAILGKTPFRIAYRVVNELILHFYALRWENRGAEFEELYNKALDNILMMKVLPRIEGNEDLVKEPLAQLATWTEVAYPKANAKIVEMRERLERSHFTSFWP